MKCFLTITLMGVALVAADKPAEQLTDKEILQGPWVVTAVEADGKELRDGQLFEKMKGMKWTFKDNTLHSSKGGDDRATFTLDPDKEPATLDVVVRGEKNQVIEKLFYLYELKDGTLKVCLGPKPNAARAREFNSKRGQIILTFKREEKTGRT